MKEVLIQCQFLKKVLLTQKKTLNQIIVNQNYKITMKNHLCKFIFLHEIWWLSLSNSFYWLIS